MYKYEDTHTNVSGTFPNTLAINVTTPGAGDGTEYIAAQVNDNWGFHQALMDYAGLTPDSVTEAPGTSQMVEALQKGFGHPGEVVLWHGQADPATLGIRLLELEKQGILRADYADLDAAVYCGDGNNPTWDYYYHADNADGTGRSTTGIYLILPDSRGCTIRGYDPTNLRDPLGSVRKFPDIQTWALVQHGHEIQAKDNNNYTDKMNLDKGTGTDVYWDSNPAQLADRLHATSITGGVTQSTENRMTNLGVKICVRY